MALAKRDKAGFSMSKGSETAAPVGADDDACVDAALADSCKFDPLTLGVVAQMFKISPLLLRWYELGGLVRRRRAGNRRTFSWTDCERIALIVKARDAGLSVGALKAVIRPMSPNAPRAVTQSGRRACLALIQALERRQRALGNVLAELYRIDREFGEHLGELDKGG
jgi:DNA-binding transcriptional MerR regulator